MFRRSALVVNEDSSTRAGEFYYGNMMLITEARTRSRPLTMHLPTMLRLSKFTMLLQVSSMRSLRIELRLVDLLSKTMFSIIPCIASRARDYQW